MKASVIAAIAPILISLIGGIFWLSSIHAKANENYHSIQDVKEYHVKIYEKLSEMNQRLSRIEGKLSHKGE